MFIKERVLFDEKSHAHQKLISALWDLCFPGEEKTEGLKTQAWQRYGFQGKDPRTDL